MKLLCFAQSTKDEERKLEGQSEELYEHLVKIWMFPDVREQTHWKREVGTKFLTKVNKLKSTKKYPKPKLILKWTWNIWEDALIDRIPSILDQLDENPLDVNYSNIYKSVQEYFIWAAQILSNRGSLFPSECYNKIEELRDKYFKEKVC